MTAERDVDELLAFVAHALVRHAERWRRNGASLPVLAIPLARLAAQSGTGRQSVGDHDAAVDDGEMAPSEPLLLTTKQTAKLLQISERSVRSMLADGRLESVKLGSAVRIPRGAVEALAAGCPPATSPRFRHSVEVKADEPAGDVA